MSGVVNLLVAGGPVIWLLSVMSLGSLALIAVKMIELRSVRAGAAGRDRALELWQSGDRREARKALQGAAPADRVADYAMEGIETGLTRQALESELARRGNAEVEAMNRHIRILELVAMVSPLLGLLGTVLGMIQSFQDLEMAAGAANASVLAGGIWQALLTTAAGLIVAIPAAVGASLLAARVESASQLIEDTVGRLILVETSRGGLR